MFEDLYFESVSSDEFTASICFTLSLSSGQNTLKNLVSNPFK